MKVTETRLPGVLLLEPRVFRDERGQFLESWNQDRYRQLGVPGRFVQDNLSVSRRGVLRGLHFQNPHPQGKLVSVPQGAVFDVVVDLRVGSSTFGEWLGVELSSENFHQLYIPQGFAHGFQILSETALFSYKCTDYYYPDGEGTVLWNDPDLEIDWPLGAPILSPKDQVGIRLRDFPRHKLPSYHPPAARDARS